MSLEASKELVEIDVNQLIEFISTISKFGSQMNKIKIDFDLYAQEILDRFPINDPFIRVQLQKIPALVRSSIDPNAKMITMQKYSSALIALILEDITNQENAQFFKIKESEKTNALKKELLNKRKKEAATEIDFENYQHNLHAQQDQTERRAILALATSIEDRLAFLEQHQIKLSNEVYTKIYEALEKTGAFDNLKDINGNPILFNEEMQKNIVQAITNNYIDGFVEFSIQRQMIAFDRGQNIPEQDPPILHFYENNGNNLFEDYHRYIENQMHRKVYSALEDNNLRVDRPGIEGLGNHFHKEIKNNKNAMMEIANNKMEILQNQSTLENINTKNIKSDRRQNRFSAP